MTHESGSSLEESPIWPRWRGSAAPVNVRRNSWSLYRVNKSQGTVNTTLPTIYIHQRPMAASHNISPTTSAQGLQLEPHHILCEGAWPTPKPTLVSSTSSSSQAAVKARKDASYLDPSWPKACSSSSRNTQSSSSTRVENQPAWRGEVRTLPRMFLPLKSSIYSH
jgi:hypothetical protein